MNHEWNRKIRGGRPTRYDRHQVVLVDAEQYDGGFPPESAEAFVDWLSDLIESVPEEFRGSTTIELNSSSGYEGSHYAHIKVAYRRPETDEELGRRVQEYERAVAEKEAHDRQEFERLKSKFGT